METAKNQNHNPSFLPGVKTLGYLSDVHSGTFRQSESLLWNGGGAAAAARVRWVCAVEALLRLEFLVLLVQAKRTKKKKKDIVR